MIGALRGIFFMIRAPFANALEWILRQCNAGQGTDCGDHKEQQAQCHGGVLVYLQILVAVNENELPRTDTANCKWQYGGNGRAEKEHQVGSRVARSAEAEEERKRRKDL